LDTGFELEDNGIPVGLALQADGKILAAGSFVSLGGEQRNLIGRLANDTAALQRLAMDSAGTTAMWYRGGSAPEVEQVTFEASVDRANYTTLGNATRFGGGWQLGGLSLPAGQNFYLRARGRTAGGRFNGSSGLVESVAQFWRLPPPYLDIVTVVGSGVFQFAFTNTNAMSFSVLASGDLAAPTSAWENLGTAVPVGNGIYQFSDSPAVNYTQRFYQVRSP